MLTLARAHDPGISTAEVQLQRDRLVIVNGFAPDDARLFLPRENRSDDRWAEDTFEEVRPLLLPSAPLLWEIRAGGEVLRPRESTVQLLPGDNVSFQLVYPPVRPGTPLSLRALRLGELGDFHRQFVIVADEHGSTLTKKLIRATDPVLEVPVAAGQGTPAPGATAAAPAAAPPEPEQDHTFWSFLRLGMEHIWTGYDHLLFLFALLVVCRSFRSVLLIVSCFTLAHSITLAVATLDLLSMPARWVEPAIAASIVFVGVENLVRRGSEPRGRWALTFVFGLVHGFGFASVLRDLGVGRIGSTGVAMPLFSFNVGVELGQVVIAAVVVPLLWWLRTKEAFVSRGVPALSAVVALAGTYWFISRVT